MLPESLADRCERAITDLESLLGGRNGPSIQLRAWVRELATQPPAQGEAEEAAFWRWLYHSCPTETADAMRREWLASKDYAACRHAAQGEAIDGAAWKELLWSVAR